MRKFLFLPFILLVLLSSIAYSKNELYEKIDLFGEVLENIKKEYVDDVNQSEIMDSAINGVLQSLDPYSAYMSPELFREMQTDTKGEFGGYDSWQEYAIKDPVNAEKAIGAATKNYIK